MRSLIVLCAGNKKLSSGYALLEKHPHEGIRLAYKAIKDIFPESFDRIIYTILQEDEEKYSIVNCLSKEIPSNLKVEFCILEKMTSGPAETAYKTIVDMKLEGEIYIRDSHNYIKLNKPIEANCIAGIDLTEYEDIIENLRRKSFLLLNEQNRVMDIVEKSFKSDVISVGLYGFRCANDYLETYEKLNDKMYAIDKLYISHIISYMIGYANQIFYEIPVQEFEDWGNTASWNRLQERFATYFIDLSAFQEINEEERKNILDEINRRQARGATVVGCTFLETDEDYIRQQFENYGIHPQKILCGINCSKEKIFVSNVGDL